MAQFEHLVPPPHSERIVSDDPQLLIPDHPMIPFCRGDGEWPKRWPALQKTIDAAVKQAYADKKSLDWFEIQLGQNALQRYKTNLPKDSLEALRTYVVGLIAPLNMAQNSRDHFQRQMINAMDLSLCKRPVTSTNSSKNILNRSLPKILLINDLCEGHAGKITWEQDSAANRKMLNFVQEQLREKGLRYPASSTLHLQAQSIEASERLMRGLEHIFNQDIWNKVFFVGQNAQDLFLQHTRSLVGHRQKLSDAQFMTIDQFWSRLFAHQHSSLLVLSRDDLAEQIMATLEGLFGSQGTHAMAQINVDSGHAIFCPTQAFLPPANADTDTPIHESLAQDQALLRAAVMMLQHINWTAAAEALVHMIADMPEQEDAAAEEAPRRS